MQTYTGVYVWKCPTIKGVYLIRFYFNGFNLDIPLII